MITWILILTLPGYHAYSGAAIHSIPGFQTREACVAAGAEWQRQVVAARSNSNAAIAVCAPQK